MAITNAIKAVSTTAVALNSGESGGQRLYLFNFGPNPAYLGSSSVTGTTGVPIAATASLMFVLDPGDLLYAVCKAAESASVGVLSL